MPSKPPPEYASPPPPQRTTSNLVPLPRLLLESGPFTIVAFAIGVIVGHYAAF